MVETVPVSCSLCQALGAEPIDTVLVDDLVDTYQTLLGVDVASEFLTAGPKEIVLFHCGRCDLRFFSPKVTGSEQFYRSLQHFDWYYQESKPEYVVAARFVHPGDRVLELGCGKGAFARYVPGSEYTGLEISRDAQSMALSSGLKVIGETIEEHAAHMPNAYDVVVGFQILEHLATPRRALERAVDCLRPGGRIILSVPAEDSYLRHSEVEILNLPPHHQTRWSDRALESIATLLGLELVALEHDALRDVHLRSYAEVMVETVLRRMLGQRVRCLRPAKAARMRKRLARFLAVPVARALQPTWMRPRGHDITVVFRRR